MLCHSKLLRCLFACQYTMLPCLPGVALTPPASSQCLHSCLALQKTQQQQFLTLCWVALPSQMLSNLLSREWTFGHRSIGSTGLFGLVFSLVQSFCWLAFVSSTRKLQSCDCIIQCKISKNTHFDLYIQICCKYWQFSVWVAQHMQWLHEHQRPMSHTVYLCRTLKSHLLHTGAAVGLCPPLGL